MRDEYRHRLQHRLARIADKCAPYGMYRLPERELVGTLDAGLDRARAFLREHGYEYNALAAIKLHPDDGRADDGSYRRIDPCSPAKQWHVHLYDAGGTTEVYSHYEYKPWPTRPLDIDRPLEHYLPSWGRTYLPGRHCGRLRELLESRGRYEGDESLVGSAELPPPEWERGVRALAGMI